MNRRHIIIGIVLLLASVIQAQELVRVEYFFDTDPGYGKGFPLTKPNTGENTYEMSFESVTPGYHLLGVRAQNKEGRWSSVLSRPIYVNAALEAIPVKQIEYFFDTDPGYGKGFPLTKPSIGENTYEMSFESLTPGYHLLSLRAQDELGRWSTVMSRPIFVTNSVKMAVEYFIDKDPGEGKAVSVSMPEDLSNAFAFEVPTEQLEVGEHLLCVRSKGDNGIWKMVSSKTFTVGKAGDVNGDGNVDEEDLSLIVQAIMGQLSNEDLRKKTDINHDGKVDAADLVALTNLILYGKIVPK